MSLADIRRAERELENLRRAEAEKHVAALKELGYDVSVAGARTTITTKTAPRAKPAGHRRGGKKLRGPAHNKRDIAGITMYREKFAAAKPGDLIEIAIPPGFTKQDIQGPVSGGASRAFGKGNFCVTSCDESILVQWIR
jgi:hypothetical protein